MFASELFGASFGRLWLEESLTIPWGVRSERASILGRWLVWRYFERASTLVAVVSCLLWLFLLLTSLGSRRRPDAGLGLGVRLVVLGLSLWWF